MTENEAIEELKYDCSQLGKAIPCDTGWGQAINTAYGMAVEALEEVRKYRAIGTLEECREAVEKQKAKEPIPDEVYRMNKYCPNCGVFLASKIGKKSASLRVLWASHRLERW